MDNLDTYIIKLTRQAIVPSVCHILNLSIQANKFQNKWKLAKVVSLSTKASYVRCIQRNTDLYRVG